jgi:poly-beta-1,6-N-acetyl-D-glucosamine N-deacetylase
MMHLKIPRTIVTYHVFSNVENFEKHLKILSKKEVLLTTDDGDLSFYQNAFPLIKKYKIPSILFIIPSLIGTETPFWWREVVHYMGASEGLQKVKQLKSIPNKERVGFLENLRNQSTKPPLKQIQLSVEQLKEMQEYGIVIGNHSFTHPMFDTCDSEELQDEIVQTKLFFEKHNLEGFHLFAYPNGNYNDLAEHVLKNQGITHAFLFDHKINGKKINPLRISRLSVNDYTPVWKYRFILSGWHSKLVPLTKFIYKLKKI